jgi:hypothetical protein
VIRGVDVAQRVGLNVAELARMVPIAAVILTDSTRTKFAGLELNERAAHIAHRAGIFDVHFIGEAPPSDDVLARLRAAGWRVTVTVGEGRPLETAPLAQTVVVLPARTIIEPAALVALIQQASLRPSDPALVVAPAEHRKSHVLRMTDGTLTSVMGDGNAVSTGIAILPEASLARVRRVWDYRDAIHRLAKTGSLRALTATDWFCVPLDAKTDVRTLERDYIAHTGASAGLLTTGARSLAALVTEWWNEAPLTYRSPARA